MSGHSDDVPRRLARLFERYFEPLGWGQPVESGPVARDGAPVPWITYPAMATLERLTQPGLRVFEFGCGHSSLWWAGKVSEVVGVDHDLAWLEPIRARARPNQTLLHRPVHAPPEPIPAGMAAHIQALIAGQWSSGDSHFDTVHGHNCRDFLGYATSLLAWPQGYFDLIVVDGMARSLCAYLAAHWVRPGGPSLEPVHGGPRDTTRRTWPGRVRLGLTRRLWRASGTPGEMSRPGTRRPEHTRARPPGWGRAPCGPGGARARGLMVRRI